MSDRDAAFDPPAPPGPATPGQRGGGTAPAEAREVQAPSALAQPSARSPYQAHGPNGSGPALRRRASLRVPLISLVVAVNLAAFLVLTWVTVSLAERERATALQRRDDFALGLVSDILDERGMVFTQWLLDLSFWRYEPVADVVVAQVPERDALGRWVVQGVYVNPQGRAGRGAEFDEQRVLDGIATVVRSGGRFDLDDGSVVLPITLPGGDRWGGCWYRPHRDTGVAATVIGRILPWFAVTLLVATLVTLVAVRRLVIDPVSGLAAAAGRVEGGDLTARVPEMERNDELASLVRGFNAMAAQVEHFSASLEREVAHATDQARRAETAAMTQRRLAATGELAAGVAHEINNPVGGLLNAIERLERSDLSPERRQEYFALVRSGLERIRETVGRLLRLAPRAPEVALLALRGPIEDAFGLVHHRALLQNVRFVVCDGHGAERDADTLHAFDLWAPLGPIRGAANELGQAVLNLFVNALDALEARERGEVRLTLVEEQGVQRLTVVDDGPGVDDEVLARAADAFFTTKSQGRGTGLGLAIVHHVAHAHGGRVLLWSQPGCGFRVELELPVAGPSTVATP
ncbi:MAG: HAMP domain-containing sensor histidine kinase [Planctomycetota bacterium]